MKFTHVRTFVTIAETRSFAAAARSLGLAQPAVSKQMAKLEQELGTQLFVRELSGVRLTSAGESFLREARRMVELHDRALTSVRPGVTGEPSELHVAYAELLQAHESLVAAISVVFAARALDVELRTHRLGSADQWEAIDKRRIHAGVGYGAPAGFSDVSSAPLAHVAARSVMIPATHPLAGAPRLRLSDLGALPLLLFAREVNPPLHDRVLAALAERGLTPRLRTGFHSHTAREAAVRAGQGWMLAIDGLPEHAEGIVARQVDDAPILTTLSLFWRRDETAQSVLSFVELALATREQPPG